MVQKRKRYDRQFKLSVAKLVTDEAAAETLEHLLDPQHQHNGRIETQ